MKLRILAVLLLASAIGFAADREFDEIVKAIESHYGTHPEHVPLMGLANFAVRTAHPAGVSGFKIAVFDNLDASQRGDSSDLDAFMNTLSVRDMRPLVQVRSQASGESTYVFAGESGKSTKMLIANFGRNEATVVQVRMSMEALIKALQDPQHIGDSYGSRRDDP